MPLETTIVRRQVETEDAFELRMRIAAEFLCLAGQFHAEVWIIRGGRRYNGRSMRDLLSMVAGSGSRLDLEAQGPDAEQAIAALARAIRPLEALV